MLQADRQADLARCHTGQELVLGPAATDLWGLGHGRDDLDGSQFRTGQIA